MKTKTSALNFIKGFLREHYSKVSNFDRAKAADEAAARRERQELINQRMVEAKRSGSVMLTGTEFGLGKPPRRTL